MTNHPTEPSILDASPPETGAGVLLVDSDAFARGAFRARLEAHGYAVTETSGAADAIACCTARGAGAVRAIVADLGSTRALRHLIDSLRAAGLATPVVASGADAVARDAIDWIRAGAVDVLLKPIDHRESIEAIERALQRASLAVARSTAADSGRRGGGRAGLAAVLGADPRLHRALALAKSATSVRTTVLIEGESGTGKSMLARAIHESSSRASGPFVDLACGSVPETLLESELFGHVKGAFTGALADKKGRFLAADGGTLFLDEINSATPAMQLKLLRVLQERRFEPVGSDDAVEVDVRVIVASNQPLSELVARGRFRQDLFYRIHVLPIVLPPLRERPGDARMLAAHFLATKSAELGRTILGFSSDALDALARHAWPGNVRELENAVERATILCDGPRIELEHLPPTIADTAFGPSRAASEPSARARRDAADREWSDLHPSNLEPSDREPSDLERPAFEHSDLGWPDAEPAHRGPHRFPGAPHGTPSPGATRDDRGPRSLAESMRDPERRALVAALDAHGWSRTDTAKALGINRATLYRKMRDLGIADTRRSA